MARRLVSGLASFGLFIGSGLLGQESPAPAPWVAPLSWSPAAAAHAFEREKDEPVTRVQTAASTAVPTSPMPLIGVTPCRIADTRDGARPPGYGPPALSAGSPRDFTLTGVCGIADAAEAVSLNITVVSPQGLGYILIYPQGAAQPVVSTLNYTAGVTVANAAIVPIGANGGITVAAAVAGTEVLIDTNGYYAATGAGIFNTFLGAGAGNFTMTGEFNTGLGSGALSANDTGESNVATGSNALLHNTSGEGNTGFGAEAIRDNTTGSRNTALGISALVRNTAGGFNTALGQGALYFAEGDFNIGLGAFSGTNLNAGGNNMYLGSAGGAQTESNTVRIGGDTHYRTFLSAVRGVTTDAADAVPVVIDSAGQLGTISSSARFKEDIGDMADASSGLLKLRPVTFRYRGRPGGERQFGLVAEEVEQVLPELVVCDASGDAETVLYHQMPAMLLNELQKQQKKIDGQAGEIAALRSRLAALEMERCAPEEKR